MMIEAGKRYKLKASKKEMEIISMSKSGRHATIKFVGERTEYKLSTSDIETAIVQEMVAVGQKPYIDDFPLMGPIRVIWSLKDWRGVYGSNPG